MPAAEPRVSVGIPTWNRADLLRECIQSVLDQTLTDFEIWVFDNASTDHTPDVVAAFDDPRINYVRNPQNLGNQPNSTKAMRAGSAPYHVMLFDDDYLLPECLERKARFLDDHADVVCVHSMFEIRDDSGEVIRERSSFCGLTQDTIESGGEFIEKSMLKPARIHISSAMYRRDVCRHEGLFREDYPADDHALWLRIASRGDIGFIAEPLDGLRTTPGVSAANGFHEITAEGLYRPTLIAARGGNDVKTRFLVTYPATRRQAAHLRRLAAKGTRRTVTQVLVAEIPGFRPPAKAARLLLEAVRIEPSILVEPRLLRVLRPNASRPSRPADAPRVEVAPAPTAPSPAEVAPVPRVGPSLVVDRSLPREFDTERLTLRPFTEQDVPAYAAITSDPEVMRYIGTRPLRLRETWEEVAKFIGHWELRGYGQWAVLDRKSGALIGRVGFHDPPDWPGPELGWLLAREHWGHGYATEAAAAAADFAFDRLGAHHIYSVINQHNAPSLRVAERIGETYDSTFDICEQRPPALLFSRSRDGADAPAASGAATARRAPARSGNPFTRARRRLGRLLLR